MANLDTPTNLNISSLIDVYPACIYIKNLNGKYIDINEACLTIMVDNSYIDQSDKRCIIGKTDYQLFNQTVAEQMDSNDRQVLSAQQEICFEEFNISPQGQRILHTTTKKPLFNSDNQLCGLIGVTLTKTEIINHPHNQLFDLLTKREQECIHYYWKGLTSYETAKKMHLSPRTIESYFEVIKNKLQCKSKRDLMRLNNCASVVKLVQSGE